MLQVLLQCCRCCCSVAGVAAALLHQGLADEGDGVGTEQPTMAALHTIYTAPGSSGHTHSVWTRPLAEWRWRSFTQL